ncbi:MAG TPA: hypothetical protein VJ372_04335 [Pyrinomonadaceae bacterium]|jgi:hypothetical protein|nr:hypothetical protein [Pyrinomonadaceae bacterium]
MSQLRKFSRAGWPHFESEFSVLVPIPAGVYLRLVSRESGMLRSIVSNFYRDLRVVRELQAVVL